MADDKPAEKKDAPLKNPEVHIEVTPKERGDKEYAQKVKEGLKGEVKKELKAAEKDGAKKQLDAAEKVADDAKKGVDPSKITKIRIKVEGEVGTDGDKVSREKTIIPKEGG